MPSTMDMASVAAFRATLKNMMAATQRPAGEVVKQAYINFLQSARENTGVGKEKLRKVISNPAYASRKRGEKVGKYLIVVRTQRRGIGKIIHLPTSRKKDPGNPIRKVPRRGLAKQSWNWMFAGIGMPGESAMASRAGVSPSRLVKVKAQVHRIIRPSVEYENRLSYLQIANPGIHALALRNAAKKMQSNLDRGIKSKYERMWA